MATQAQGRPRRNKDERVLQLTVTVLPSHLEVIERLTKQKPGESRARVIRDLLDMAIAQLAEQPTPEVA